MGSELFDFSGSIKHETDKACLITYDGMDYWLPKSMLENHRDGTFTIPEWLAIEKDMV